MSETFEYPNATSPTKTLTFETGNGTNGHSINDVRMVEKNQLTDQTIGGTYMAKNLGSDITVWEYTVIVRISSASYTDVDDVIEFYGSSYANGAVNAFVWTDKDSTARTVRFINSSLQIEYLSNTYARITMTLREE